MSLTISPSPFGSLVVSVAETGSILSVTTVATSPAVLSMALGVPGPAGATGSQGPAGTNGTNGVGVPVGGTAGQVLAKIDGTNYNTEWVDAGAAGDFLPLSGGTMSGTIFLPSLRNLLNTDLTVTAYNDTGAGTNFIHTFDAFDGTFALATNGGGLKFPDETVQVTAGLPLTGGTMSGAINSTATPYTPSLNVDIYEYENRIANAQIGSDGTYGFIKLQGESATSIGLYGNSDGTFIKFGDETTQTTAFTGYTGTTSQYIRGDGSLATYGPLGDRYLTSSTTSLTIGNGTKTLTVGTGLSYSPLQEVTIAYNVGNHMHASVTSYNSTTGVMVVDVSKHSGSGTYSAWTVNVGGVVGGSYLEIANNLSDLQSSTQARVNLGLGTMSTEPASAYLSTASAVANYQTISGMSAYLSTASAVANYLTQSNAASTYLTQSSASSTYIAQTSFATLTQAQAGTSTTTVINPSTLLDAKYFQGGKSMVQIAWSTSVSGAGASAGAQNSNARLNVAPTTATGYAIASAVIANNSRGQIYNNGFDFSKRVQFGVRVARNVASPDSNSVFRFSIGKISATDASDLSARGLMIKVAGSGALQLLVHNGSGLTTTTSSFTPANGQAYDVILTSDGAGNCALFVNGSSVATSTGGPTTSGLANANYLMFEVQNTSTITGSPQNICVSDYHVQVNS